MREKENGQGKKKLEAKGEWSKRRAVNRPATGLNFKICRKI